MATDSKGKGAPTGTGAGCRPAFQTSDQTALQKLLECPICKRIAKPPIHTCQDDKHLICEECLKTLTQQGNARCPICSTQISETRSTYIEQCMDGILLDCHYRNDGCQLNLKATEYREHLLVCWYREIPCFMLNCGDTVAFKEFFTHLTTKHKDKVNGVENMNRHVVEWWIEGDSRDASARWPPYFFTCFNNVFLYTAISTLHGMWEWAYILADQAEASRFQVVSNISNPDKTAELRWKGAVHPIGKPIEEIAESGLCFVTNSKEMRNPYVFQKKNKQQQRHYWRTDVEIVELHPPKPGTTPYIVTTEKNKTDGTGKVDTGTARRLSLDNDNENDVQREKAKSIGMGNTDVSPLPFSEKPKSDRKSLKITDEIPSTSTSEKPKIPLSDIGNQNEESPRPKGRQRSVKVLDPEPLIRFSEEVVADGDIDGRKKSSNGTEDKDDKEEELAPEPEPTPTPAFDPEEAKRKKSVFRVAELEDDRYFESDNTQ